MSFQPDLFRGKTALVTGGTTGIGAAAAEMLATLGASVHAVGLGAENVAGSVSGVTFNELDVADDEGVRGFIEGLDGLDILVNCAGIIRRVEEHELDVFERVVDINLNGTMRCCVAARAKLAERRGCIVNHQVACDCLCRPGSSGQCCGAGLDCDAAHQGVAG